MLFRISNHYEIESDESDETKKETNEEIQKEDMECFICFDNKIDSEYPVRLKYQIHYFKYCYCDGYIHMSCLNIWYENYKECPICRKSIKEADYLEIYNLYQYYYGFYIIMCYIKVIVIKTMYISKYYIIRITPHILSYIFIFLIYNVIHEIYKNIINELEKKKLLTVTNHFRWNLQGKKRLENWIKLWNNEKYYGWKDIDKYNLILNAYNSNNLLNYM